MFPVHDGQPHMPVEVDGSVVGSLGEDIVTGLRDGRVQPLSHEQPLHFELDVVVLLVVVSGSGVSISEGGSPHDVEPQRHVSAVAYLRM